MIKQQPRSCLEYLSKFPLSFALHYYMGLHLFFLMYWKATIFIIRMKILIAFVFLSPLTELSTGLLTFAQFGHKDITDAKVLFDGSFLQVDKLLYFFINFAVKTQNSQAPLGL